MRLRSRIEKLEQAMPAPQVKAPVEEMNLFALSAWIMSDRRENYEGLSDEEREQRFDLEFERALRTPLPRPTCLPTTSSP